jgi:hypothetical protein
MNNEFGIIYVATGNTYLAECTISAGSAKKVMPDIPITLWTDSDMGMDQNNFDFIHKIRHPEYSFFDKIAPLIQTEYKKTLFVDTDTYFIKSVYEISTLLERFELAYAHAPWRVPPWEGHFLDEIPICFPEPNTGVIAYRKNDSVMQLISDWEQIYAQLLEGKHPPRHDQSAFRTAIYFSQIRSVVLPPEYNIRTNFPVFKGGGCPAKILHGREPSLSHAIDQINSHDGIKIFDFRKQAIKQAQNLQAKLRESKKQIQALRAKERELNNGLQKIRKSYAIRLGQMLIDSVTRPGRNTVALPARFYRLIRDVARSSVSKARPGNVFFTDNRFLAWKGLCDKRTTQTPIACWISRRLHSYLDQDVVAERLTPDSWLTTIEKQTPKILLIESCLTDIAPEWGNTRSLASNSDEQISKLISCCKKRGIPVIFWHTEPPEHTAHYTALARRCDYVFAVQAETVSAYKRILDRNTVDILPWAIQPALHNPVWRGKPPKDLLDLNIVIDGWSDLIEYTDDFKAYLPLLNSGLHILESRWRYKSNKLKDSPAFRKAIKGCLSEEQMRNALKRYKLNIFPKYTLKSESTLVRMILESAAAKTPAVYHGTMNLPELDGLVTCREDSVALIDYVRELLADSEALERIAHLVWREVFSRHTYAHRLKQIFETVGVTWEWFEYPPVACITVTNRPQMLEHAKANYLRQIYPAKEWIVVLNTSKVNIQEVERKIADAGKVRVVQLNEDFNIGACLNLAMQRAGGEFWFKMDDDDYYGENYLSDMMLAEKSVHPIIFGKPRTYMYFESKDAVYKRVTHKTKDLFLENVLNPRLCGGAMAGRKEISQSVTFSQDARACVDSEFYFDCIKAEIPALFIDTYNFIAYRSGNKAHHTWRVEDKVLQRKAAFVSKGKAFSRIMI